MFGSELERVFGRKRFLNLYFGGVIAAAIMHLLEGCGRCLSDRWRIRRRIWPSPCVRNALPETDIVLLARPSQCPHGFS